MEIINTILTLLKWNKVNIKITKKNWIFTGIIFVLKGAKVLINR